MAEPNKTLTSLMRELSRAHEMAAREFSEKELRAYLVYLSDLAGAIPDWADLTERQRWTWYTKGVTRRLKAIFKMRQFKPVRRRKTDHLPLDSHPTLSVI